MHIDMDAFFASIEQVINPKLKGRPLIVGSRENKFHTVVCSASYEAKAFGIESGMPTSEAFKLCPNLEFVAADQAKYIWTSEQILEILKTYGFEVIQTSIDEFEMDISNQDPQNLAKDIQKRIEEAFNITASIGIAKNSTLAKLASKINKPNGIFILTQENLEVTLAGTPIEKLSGIGQKSKILFESLGVETCLDLYKKSEKFLKENLGKNGLNLYVSLHTTDYFESNQREEIKSIGHSYTLSKASENPEFIKAWIRLLSEMIARRLRGKRLASKTVLLWLSGPEMPLISAQKTYREPTNDGLEIYSRSLKIMAKIGIKSPKIRALGVSCRNLSLDNYIFFLKEEKRKEGLLKTIDTINNRYGEWSIYPAIISLTRNCLFHRKL